jgi:ribosomal protein L37E
MFEMKGKLETTYVWTCSRCEKENRMTDDTTCSNCGKELGEEHRIRHFKLTPEPIKLGFYH